MSINETASELIEYILELDKTCQDSMAQPVRLLLSSKAIPYFNIHGYGTVGLDRLLLSNTSIKFIPYLSITDIVYLTEGYSFEDIDEILKTDKKELGYSPCGYFKAYLASEFQLNPFNHG